MTDLPSLVHQLATAAPILHEWEQGAAEDGYPSGLWLDLAHAVLQETEAQVLGTLRSIAPILEKVLSDLDPQDDLALGFIEPLIRLLDDRGWDSRRFGQDLGPMMAATWEDLWDYLHQSSWWVIDFAPRWIRGFQPGVAHFEDWVARPREALSAGAPVAHIRVNGHPHVLLTVTDCHLDRFGPTPDQPLPLENLLCYLRLAIPRAALDPPFFELRPAAA